MYFASGLIVFQEGNRGGEAAEEKLEHCILAFRNHFISPIIDDLRQKPKV